MNLKKIGICVTTIHDISVHRMLTSLGQEARKRGYDLQIWAPFSNFYNNTKNDEAQKRIFDLIPFDQLCGLIIFTDTIKDASVCQMLVKNAQHANIPVFSLKRGLDGCCNMKFDSASSLKEMIRHVIEVHHCKKINFMAGLRGNEVSEQRTEIYKEILSEYHYEIEEDRIGYGDFWTSPAKQATEKFLNSSLPLPDAIICANDAMAFAVCDCLTEHGLRVPEDIIVTGLGGIRERDYHLPLLTTTIYEPNISSVYLFEAFEKILAGEMPFESEINVPCKNIYTESCGCIVHDEHDSEIRLVELYSAFEKERNYCHATHELTSLVNEKGNIMALAEYLHNYLKEPGITALNLYLDLRYAYSTGFDISDLGDAKWILLNQITGTHWDAPLTPLSPQERYTLEEELYGQSGQILYIPLNNQEKNYGILAINYNGSQIVHECLYELVMTLDNLLSSLKKCAKLIRINEQLNAVSEQTIQSLAEIVEAKSEFTGLHVKRVSEYTRILANAMGQTPDEVDVMRIASMMHDIGKINIPSSILEKPGKLTPEEFNIIKTHVTEGAKMLSHAPGRIMETAHDIALHHHEKWDGTGYLGLKGEQIPLESRIVALADVFDALVSRRPYKESFSEQFAYDIITKESGSHFDPYVVNIFKENFDLFLTVYGQYKDS